MRCGTVRARATGRSPYYGSYSGYARYTCVDLYTCVGSYTDYAPYTCVDLYTCFGLYTCVALAAARRIGVYYLVYYLLLSVLLTAY